MKRSRKLWAGVLALFSLVMVVAGTWFAYCPAPDLTIEGPRSYPVYVLYYHWHSAIAWEQKNLPPHLAQMGAEGWPSAPIVEFGWGDQSFFFERDESLLSLLRMAISGSPSVLHVVSLAELPRVPRQTIFLDEAGMLAVQNFVDRTFRLDDRQQRRVLGRGHYGVSNFYEAVPLYSLWFNCNNWTAQVLHHGGVHICPRRILLIQQLQDALEVFTKVTRSKSVVFPAAG